MLASEVINGGRLSVTNTLPNRKKTRGSGYGLFFYKSWLGPEESYLLILRLQMKLKCKKKLSLPTWIFLTEPSSKTEYHVPTYNRRWYPHDIKTRKRQNQRNKCQDGRLKTSAKIFSHVFYRRRLLREILMMDLTWRWWKKYWWRGRSCQRRSILLTSSSSDTFKYCEQTRERGIFWACHSSYTYFKKMSR